VKVLRTVATGGVEKRVLGYRALHRPTFGFRVDRELKMNPLTS
jgi:hypothetical protein